MMRGPESLGEIVSSVFAMSALDPDDQANVRFPPIADVRLTSAFHPKRTLANVRFGWKPDVRDLDNGVIQPSFEKPMPVPLSSCWQMILRNLMRRLKCGEPFDIDMRGSADKVSGLH